MKHIEEQIADRLDAVAWCNKEGGTWVYLGEKFKEDANTMQAMLDVVLAAKVVQLSMDGDDVDCPFCAYDGLREALDKLEAE